MSKLPWFVQKYEEYDPKYFSLIKETVEEAMNPKSLDDKTKYLILLALDVAKGAAAGIRVLARQARAAGATEGEIREVLRLVYFVNSIGAVRNGLYAYDESN